MRRKLTVALRVVLLAIFTAPFLTAGAAAQDDDSVLARYAVLLGDRVEAPQSSRGAGATTDAAEELLTWDYRRDNAELERLFGLERIGTLQVGSARLSATGGEFSAASPLDGAELLVRVRVDIKPFEDSTEKGRDRVAAYQLEISHGGEVLSAPSVVSLIGERAMITTAMSDEPQILWLVVQLDDLPLAEGK